MDIKVTTTKVIVDSGYIVNRQEYKVNPCEFTFTEEYEGLVKKAIFVAGSIEVERAIINNKCDIPYDVLDEKMFELRVYAYEVQNDELVIRYSPTYAKIFLREGSYRGVTGSGEVITPTQFEQYESALNEGLAELEEGLQEVANVDIDASKSGTTATVTITNRNGVQKSVEIEDGTDYVITEQDYRAIANVVEGDITPLIPTKTSDLVNNSGFIDKDVNNLTNYSDTSTMNTAISDAVGVETLNRQNADIDLQRQIDAITSSTDVVDVVGTYTELQNYDTSKLTNNDVIKVLQDSTHSNAISYYRWVVTGGTGDWTYLGSEGPFYTKGETNTLLDGKQDAIDSSHKLNADLIDDTTSTNKLTNATEKSNWDSKYDKPSGGIPKTDLSSSVQTSLGKADSAVQNTDYATNDSAGVIRSGWYGFNMSGARPVGLTFSYSSYTSQDNATFICKGTLDNVLTAVVGDINTLLDTINGEVIS